MTVDSDDTVFVALIGDIRGSREVDDRKEVQAEFKRVVETLNDRVRDSAIASPFTVTTGDEFQVLLTDARAAVEAAVTASDRFHPTGLRFGIGCGTLETDVNPDQAIGMDGPCFHRARAAINAAQQDGAWLRVSGWSNGLDQHVNAMSDLVQCVREDWTDRQAEFAHTLMETGAQKHVAAHYDVSKSTVSESLSAGHVQEVRAAENAVAAFLQEHLSGCETP